MQKVYFLVLFSFLSSLCIASDGDNITKPSNIQKEFKGTLEYIEFTPFDTTYYKVYVTDGKIRIDSYDNKNTKGEAEKTIIYNLRENKVIAMKPSDKMYKTLDVSGNNNYNVDGCEIILNKNNYKYINGYKCVQYRIKNVKENTDITYWIPEEDFPFYYEMVSMKRSMHRVHKYFFMLPNYKVAFPMQTVERSLLREEKSSYKVTGFIESTVNDEMFEIPEDYIVKD